MRFRDILLALVVILLWSGNFVAIKIGVAELSPLVLLTLRFTLTALVFLPFVKWPGWKKFRMLAEISLYLCVIHQGLLFMAMPMLDGSTASILLQSQILFATLLGWVMLKETISWRTATGLGLGFLGLFVTLGAPDLEHNIAGFVMALLSALAIAFSYIRMRQLKDIHPSTFIAMTMGIAAPFVFILSLFLSPEGWHHLPDADWAKAGGVLAYQVLLVSVSHIIWQSLLTRNKVATVASFVLLMPPLSILLCALFLGETIGLALVGGGALVLAGVAIITLRKAQKKQPIEADPAL
ncbi:MAG TPA: DMT family transporter [Micavibrio sp.]